MTNLGIKALQIAEQELGTKEIPIGSNTGPKVKEYLSKCERKGKLLGLTTGNWCAAFASWCAFQAADDTKPPHLYRAAVAELWKDAVASGFSRPVTYSPRIGDLAIFIRGGHNPTKGEEGHVGRVSVVPDANGNYETIDGNHDNCVCRVKRKLGPDLVGWIAYPYEEPKQDPGPQVNEPEKAESPVIEIPKKEIPIVVVNSPPKKLSFLEILFNIIAKFLK